MRDRPAEPIALGDLALPCALYPRSDPPERAPGTPLQERARIRALLRYR